MPGGVMISTPILAAALSSNSISRSSSLPSRNILRKRWRVFESSSNVSSRAGVSKASKIRSSAASSAPAFTVLTACSRNIFIAISAKSRIMDSTSRPT